MLPTVSDLLGLDVIRRGSPQVVAGSSGLAARVRWVHVLELADAAHLLQGGELVLTTEFGRITNLAARGPAGAGGIPAWFGVAQASKTWPARSTTGPWLLHGKLIQRSVRFQT